mmetsp:Transcript_2152/g.7688  ORF Transcript_2152/g.7688 Transcript_2152/m.7688 type:complete len:226 (-) Transcript_2152:461-1138(-)
MAGIRSAAGLVSRLTRQTASRYSCRPRSGVLAAYPPPQLQHLVALGRGLSTAPPDRALYLRDLMTGTEFFLVGTAHISRKSAEEVASVIQAVQPNTVMVELCPGRARQLMAQKHQEGGEGGGSSAFVQAVQTAAAGMNMPGDMTQKLLKAGMGGFYQFFRATGFDPGLEFKVAIQEAEKLGAHVVYGDVEVNTTLRVHTTTFQTGFFINGWSQKNNSSPMPPRRA